MVAVFADKLLTECKPAPEYFPADAERNFADFSTHQEVARSEGRARVFFF